MIGGLLRFAPGRLGARQDRAPGCRVIRWRVVLWLSCVTPETSWNPSPRKGGTGQCCLGRDGNRQRARGAMRQPRLAESEKGLQAGWSRLLAVKDDGSCWCRTARLRVRPCPSPSRSFARCAAPSASLTASLRHGIGRMEGQARSLLQPDAAQPSSTTRWSGLGVPHTCHTHWRSGLARS